MTQAAPDRAQHRRLLGRIPLQLLIGDWVEAEDDIEFAVHDPANGDRLALVADAAVRDAHKALDAAVAVQSDWAARSPRERADLLRRAFELLDDRADDFTLLITLEMGKPLAEAAGEVAYACDYLRYYSEEAVRLAGRVVKSPDGRSEILTRFEPVGPALLITPWNFPLAMGLRKVAAALAAGCTVILKPAQLTPLTSLLAAQLLLDVGVPAGVVNVLPTSRPAAISRALMADPRLRKISFTGSTAVGRRLLEQSAGQMLRSSMELGGNAPLLVFADADLDRAVDGALMAKLRNGGQSCVAANRLLIQQPVAERFIERFSTGMREARLGAGTEPGVTVGPLINEAAVAKAGDLVTDAVVRGSQVVVGGSAVEGPGSFFEPTVLTDVPFGARILHEEVFAPVAPISVFSDEAEAVRLANDTPFGLVAYLFTDDLDRAIRVRDCLEAGMIGINQGFVSNAAAPFGGIKHSGLGREGGPEGVAEYLNLKYTALSRPADQHDVSGAGA